MTKHSIGRQILLAGGMFLLLTTAVWAKGKPPYKVQMTPTSATLEVGESVQFQALLVDKNGATRDTTFQWSVSKSDVGMVDGQGLFTAYGAGTAHVVATAGSQSAKAMVHVLRDSTLMDGHWRVVITPSDTVLIPGEVVPFTASLIDSAGAVHDTTFTWRVDDETVAGIDADGILTTLERGHTFVYAEAGSLWGKARVNVVRDTLEWQWLKGLKVQVTPRDTLVAPGETVQYTATLVDTAGNPVDTTFAWSVEGPFASVDETGLLTADSLGQGFVYATAGDLSGKAHVVVRDTAANGSGKVEGTKLVIVPADTAVTPGSTVQFAVQLVDSLGNAVDTTATSWTALGREVGTLDSDGYFLATDKGVGLIKARLGRYVATTHIMVADAPDLAPGDSVQIHFAHRDGEAVGSVHRKAEKDVFAISGLPFPLNLLNGGELIFPPGSLSEGIRIEITLPSTAQVGDTTVTFADAILTGVAFHVYVNDTLVSPYYFDEPVALNLPYKPELLAELGLAPEDIWVYFYADSSGYTDGGISNVVVDTTENRIHAEIAHFSEILFASTDCLCLPVEETEGHRPATHSLSPNYPNPFNPETQIRFQVGGAAVQAVRLTIYNILGQEVRVLADGLYQPGEYVLRWDGKDGWGREVGTGIYIYQLVIGDFHRSRRMILAR